MKHTEDRTGGMIPAEKNMALAAVDAPRMELTTPQLVEVLRSSLYPDASPASVALVLDYCAAAKLDPMQKPVHIVPMWSKAAGAMKDVIMPGIGLYRIQAARSGQLAGIEQPEFGPPVTENIGGVTITYPEWCRVTVKRRLPTGEIGDFAAVERWKENYAVKGGKERSIAPNAMWERRAYAQLAKCAEAQALRRAFPEMCSAPTAEEMDGKHERDVTPRPARVAADPFAAGALPAPQLPKWTDLFPYAWGDVDAPDGRTYGEIADTDDGEEAMRALWRDDPTNPALCAWGAEWIQKAAKRVIDFEWKQLAEAAGLPSCLEECNPRHLRNAAGTLAKWIAAQEKQEGGAA